MLFSSWQFILIFLPVTFFIYFWLNRRRWIVAGKVWLVVASLFFYGYWDPRYLLLILGSILLNYALGTALAQSHAVQRVESVQPSRSRNRKVVLAIGVAANLLLLAHYKYTGFVLENVNALFGSSHALPHIVLPLAISFFTFTQIVYLVDCFRGAVSSPKCNGLELMN